MAKYSHETLRHLKPGDRLVLRFGSRGKQTAVFVRWSNSERCGIMAVVQKYRARSRKFTKDVRVEICEILEA